MSSSNQNLVLPPPNSPIIVNGRFIERAWYTALRNLVQTVGGFVEPPSSPEDLASAALAEIDASQVDTASFDIDLDSQLQDALSLIDSVFFNSANPSVKVGLVAVNGTAQTFMTSDSAPALDVTIAPTWTGVHTFAPVGNNITVNSDGTSVNGLVVQGVSIGDVGIVGQTTTTGDPYVRTIAQGVTNWSFGTQRSSGNWVLSNGVGLATGRVTVSTAGDVTVFRRLGVNNVAPPAQSVGWGVPTGPTTLINFPGATATLPQTSGVVAQLITYLKSLGFLGA